MRKRDTNQETVPGARILLMPKKSFWRRLIGQNTTGGANEGKEGSVEDLTEVTAGTVEEDNGTGADTGTEDVINRDSGHADQTGSEKGGSGSRWKPKLEQAWSAMLQMAFCQAKPFEVQSPLTRPVHRDPPPWGFPWKSREPRETSVLW